MRAVSAGKFRAALLVRRNGSCLGAATIVRAKTSAASSGLRRIMRVARPTARAVSACGCRRAHHVVRLCGAWTRGDRASSGVSGRAGRERALGSNGDGVFAGRPALRHAAGRAGTRHQERRAARDAVPHADRECSRRTRIARHHVRPQFRHAINSCTSTTRPRRRPFTIESAASRHLGTSRTRQSAKSSCSISRTWARRTTTAARCTSVRTESSTPRTARMPSLPTRRALNNLLGKIIRMNPVAGSGRQIPTDNPFFGDRASREESIDLGYGACATHSRSAFSQARAWLS